MSAKILTLSAMGTREDDRCDFLIEYENGASRHSQFSYMISALVEDINRSRRPVQVNFRSDTVIHFDKHNFNDLHRIFPLTKDQQEAVWDNLRSKVKKQEVKSVA